MKDFKNWGIILLIFMFLSLALIIDLFSFPGELKAGPPGSGDTEVLVARGKRLVDELDCAVCHEIPGHQAKEKTAAPDLAYVGDKLRPEWLFSFLRQPGNIRPWLKGRMPDFILSKEGATAITEYLSTLRDKSVRSLPQRFKFTGAPAEENLKAGRILVSPDYFDCYKCHPRGEKKPEGPPEEWAPDLVFSSRRLNPDWAIRWFQDPQKIQPGTKMPAYFSDADSGPDDVLSGDEDRQMIALRDYIIALDKVPSNTDFENIKEEYSYLSPVQGKKLVEEMNCQACHNIPDMAKAKKVGPSLAGEGSKVRKEWLLAFLKKPEVIRLDSPHRMPSFRLSPAEALALTEYLARAQVNPKIPADIFQAGQDLSALVNEGRLLIDKELGCKTCHRIGKEGALGGPNLSRVGRRLKSGWVFQWIKYPKHLQPKTPMPGVPLSDREARAITAYLMSLR